MLDRAQQWGSLGAGLITTLRAFRIYIASVMLFVGQLEELPLNFRDTEAIACRKLFPGPKGWMTADGLRELKSLYFQAELQDIGSTVTAAKARVVEFEAGGRLNIQKRAENIQLLIFNADSITLARLGWFGSWRNSSFILNLNRAHAQVKSIRGGNPGDNHWTQRQGWQTRIANTIYGHPRGLALIHLRKRLDHWPLALSPGLRVNRALAMLKLISETCQPRVWSANLRLLCNGWCTHSRFGKRGWCRMNCGGNEDSVRHLACCPIVRQLFASHGIHYTIPGSELEAFLGLSSHLNDREEVRQRAFAIYALYRVFNGLRHGNFEQDELNGAFDAFWREAQWGNN